MRLSLPGDPHLTYCTNIHAGESWPEIRAGLADYVPRIKAAVSPDRPFAVGLRLSGIAARALAEPGALADLKSLLVGHDCYVPTINAFPFGPFHGTRVKEEVYQPDWRSDERLRFTDLTATLLAELLPADGSLFGSVSTVPGTFKAIAAEPGAVDAMTRRYVAHAACLAGIERRTGRCIALAIEPEPCCFLETIEETIAYFEEHLLGSAARAQLGQALGVDAVTAERLLRRHLGVCYDVCHAAVEYEDPQGSLDALESAGIVIAKLQLTTALRVPEVGPEARDQLATFDTGTYLHQTIERRDERLRRFVDLPLAFASLADGTAGGEWRVHCHVPVFQEDLGALATTQPFLRAILERVGQRQVSPHLEVETYTWDVLPAAFRGEDKAVSIARELNWVMAELRQ